MPALDDRVGKRYGRLVAIRRVENIGKDTAWLCACDCGGEKIVKSRGLFTGHTQSCGCLHADVARDNGAWNKLPSGEAAFRDLLNRYIQGAKKRNLVFELPEEDFRKLTQSKCFYCNTEPSQIRRHKSKNGAFIYNGIDRVDNGRGYTLDNVVPCCKECNLAKGDRSQQDFLIWVERVHSHWVIA